MNTTLSNDSLSDRSFMLTVEYTQIRAAVIARRAILAGVLTAAFMFVFFTMWAGMVGGMAFGFVYAIVSGAFVYGMATAILSTVEAIRRRQLKNR